MSVLDQTRRVASEQLDQERRAHFGQFMTSSAIATFMAGMIQSWPKDVAVLEPGAGIGSLVDAFSQAFFEKQPEGRLSVTAYEIEPLLAGYLSTHLEELRAEHKGLKAEVIQRDFIYEASFISSFASEHNFSHVIMNPPYKKIAARSEYRLLLRDLGVEVVNLYTAFLGLALLATRPGGEVVAIIPRSFCNGTYFRPFREWLLGNVAIRHIHVFESRKQAFKDDAVLQENIIIALERAGRQNGVKISTSRDAEFHDYKESLVPFDEIVRPTDKESYIHIPTTTVDESSYLFTHSLSELGLSVSTGPVVDFRVRDHWLSSPKEDSVPLLYAHHFRGGVLSWPKEHKKPNALRLNDETKKWLLPSGWYTITKRFSSKEEKRRLVAYVLDPSSLLSEFIGLENHLNVIHAKKAGIEPDLARGLGVFLNSTVVDEHFRNFSGHTQVNATDLRTMKFPTKEILVGFGKWAAKQNALTQEIIDRMIEGEHGDKARAARRSA